MSGGLMRWSVYYAVTLQGHHEERLIREILGRRNELQKTSRPVADEQDIIDVDFAVSLQQIVNVVRITLHTCLTHTMNS